MNSGYFVFSVIFVYNRILNYFSLIIERNFKTRETDIVFLL